MPLSEKSGYVPLRVRPYFERVHVWSFIAFKGEIKEGEQVLHRCDYKPCWNPDHLFGGTPADNIHDMDVKGRRKNWYPSGEINPAAKLTAIQVQEIREAQGAQKDIADNYGVSKSLIWAIKNGKVWL